MDEIAYRPGSRVERSALPPTLDPADIVPSGTILRRTRTLGVIVDAAPDLDGVVALIASRLARRASLLITFVNPHSRTVAQARPGFCRQLERFDAVLPDGVGMSLAIRLLHRLPAARISFDMTSLAPAVLALAERESYSVVLIGGVPGCAERAALRLVQAFPNLRIVGAFDGYGDSETRVAQVAALAPHVVVCAMGAGAQETMLLSLVRTGWNGCGLTCGGFFDQLAAGVRYYPVWIDRSHLRWAYRLAKEPRRLWRRYLLMYPPFVAALAREALIGLILGPRPHRGGFAQSATEDVPVGGSN
jgi:N-acetylglucosaminyldiphosphoundecaprenol N-acetyl-beta-D-mannosaminyltransferase